MRSLITLTLMSLLIGLRGVAAEPRSLSYNRDIRPILSDNCFACHGPDAAHREADLRLDDEEAAKVSAIVSGNPDESEAMMRVLSSDEDLRMPPEESGKRLSNEQIKLLRQWIAEGAVYETYWAYTEPRRVETPVNPADDWPDGKVDGLISQRLKREQLRPSQDADLVTLARRLSLDLRGLPPQPEEVASLLNDSRPDAYVRYVDRLLASPAFGERMAMYWLDLVRYADTVGYHGDQDHSISPYRDYVIEAFNENMPFDQFTREQLAGDLLENPGLRQKIATGYNRLLQTSHEGGIQAKEYLAIYAADRIRNLSSVWLGATVGCAQCHDHKYDPYTITDFYSLVAFFADVDEAQHFKLGSNALPTKRPPEIMVYSNEQRRSMEEIESRLARLQGLPDAKPQIESLKKQLAAIQGNGRKTMITVSIEPREIRVLPRGNWLDDSGPVVTPAIPAFMGDLPINGSRANRLDLANWLTSQKGIGRLTARVMANRLWYLFFGVGIAKNLDDFGGQGEPPEHPELLDHLALEFFESGWDIKNLVRKIVTSRSYRQTSIASERLRLKDPHNRLYARQARQRLPAETIRDSVLSISGLLVRQQGGDSIRPYQPTGYYRHLNFPTRVYKHHADSRQWRRGVYVHWQRQFLHPMMKAFDAPSREECVAERGRSNTPLAALALLNDPSFVEAARVFAERILVDGGQRDAAKLEFAFRRALSRLPDATERAALLQLLSDSRNEYQKERTSAGELVGVGIAPVGHNVDLIDLAAWTMVARTILNLDEVITRN